MNTNWTRCKDALPDEGESVFMFNKFWDEPNVRHGFVDSGKWFFDEAECPSCNPGPTHWQHWPEGPVEEDPSETHRGFPVIRTEVDGNGLRVHLDVIGGEQGKAAVETKSGLATIPPLH